MSNKIIEGLTKPLDKEDIEFRIGTTNSNGFSLLMYKTARTDVKRLNEVCGLNWKNSHFFDANGSLCCTIEIFNEDIKEWISRTDVGTESNTEKEKGTYSDSFKRAGFKWGIGIELYQAPFIWVSAYEMVAGRNGKPEPKNFRISNIELQEYSYKDGVMEFKLVDIKTGNIIFNNTKNNTKEFVKKDELNPAQIEEIESAINVLNINKDKFLQTLKVTDLKYANYALVQVLLNKKRESLLKG